MPHKDEDPNSLAISDSNEIKVVTGSSEIDMVAAEPSAEAAETGSRRSFLRTAGAFAAKNVAYGALGGMIIPGGNSGNYNSNTPTDKALRHGGGAAMGIVAGNIIERRLRKAKNEEEERER